MRFLHHRARRTVATALAGVALGLATTACGTGPGAAAGPRPRPGVTTAGATDPAGAPASTAVQAQPAWAALLPPPGAATAGQTGDEPSASTPVFAAAMSALWQAVVTGDDGAALAAFSPEQAYARLKALPDDAADYHDRLVAHFRLDVGAAHQLVTADPAPAALVRVVVPAGAAWIAPGHCYNRLGYWHVGGARVVYQQGGVTRSFGIASLISWRGYWYVVHLGSVEPPAAQGVVDHPAVGVGLLTPTGGC
ncbi:MAG TPA: hypothetical protein VE990_18210 [Acidimicrobiales bacterium]|nr:hypothetical protein [Acidimicrobiales bacterium]